MPNSTSAPLTTRTTDDKRPARLRPPVRWLVSFAGFPLGGLAAMLLTGPVDSPGAALGGGLLTGVVLGAVQAWALGPRRPRATAWMAATAVGLAAGLGAGSWLVDYRTDLGSLVVQGAVSGAFVGGFQAVILLSLLGRAALAWPLILSCCWAAGWAVTTGIGVQVSDQFTVFGAAGAVTVTLLTAVLPFALNRRRGGEQGEA